MLQRCIFYNGKFNVTSGLNVEHIAYKTLVCSVFLYYFLK